MITRGSKIGIHSIVPGAAMPLARAAVDRGAHWPLIKGVDNAGLAIDVKAISPATLTITRFVRDVDDGCQGIEGWTDQQIEAAAQASVQIVFDRTNPDERAAADWFEVLNEADPPTPEGWRRLGRLCKRIAEIAQARGLRVALPAFNAGTPEYAEMIAFVDSGVMAALARGGHLLTIHEGALGDNDPVSIGRGDPIPGAPLPVPAGAGSMVGRYRYLYSLVAPADRPQLVISEFYAGGGYGQAPTSVVGRLAWADLLYRSDPNVIALLPFTIDPGGGWQQQNYTYAYGAVLDYLVAEKDKPNATESPMPRILGVDISEYQPSGLPWPQWAAFGVVYAITRASIGYRQDSAYPKHRDQAKAAGIITGLYHALLDSNPPNAEPIDFDPVRQAQVFWSRRQPGDELPLVIAGMVIPRWWVDLEALGVTAGALSAFLREFRRIAPGVLIGIYTSRYFWLWLIGAGHTEFANEIWWLAAYDQDPPPLPDIAKLENVVLFQFRYKKGYLPNYPNDLDLNWLLRGIAGPLPPPDEEESEMALLDDMQSLVNAAHADARANNRILAYGEIMPGTEPPPPPPVQCPFPYEARAKLDLILRDLQGNSMGGAVVPKGAIVTVHMILSHIGPPAPGGFDNRAVLAADGRNCWAVDSAIEKI